MLNAVLFDADGVLVEMVMAHYLALNKALKEISGFEIDYQEHLDSFNGLPSKIKLAKLTEQGRVRQEDHQIIFNKKQEYTKEAILESLEPDPEKIRLHKYIKKCQLKTACVTNSIKETAELMLSTTWQLKYMDLLISNEDVSEPKPSPAGYLKAMELLGVKPEETLIVEDSPVGLAAAKASGAHVWSVNGVEDVNLEGFLERVRHIIKGS